MPVFKIQSLINDLEKDVQYTLTELSTLQHLTQRELLEQPASGKWSIAQVLEHLNGYNRFYLKALEQAVSTSKVSIATEYKTGWLGQYFTKLMQPGENGKIGKKMSAPAEYNFGPGLDTDKVLSEFAAGQKHLLHLLEKARKADMRSVRVPISLTKLVKLKLGDTFRFVVAHQLRHFIQINSIRKQALNINTAPAI
ncbi:MAG: DinB family protein [Chitinophagaceae bacterium]|nr:DinB family protein [Chitinophagaceae bacterium]MCB9046211.1 DinB family protein [Chitinophagales bacterium]